MPRWQRIGAAALTPSGRSASGEPGTHAIACTASAGAPCGVRQGSFGAGFNSGPSKDGGPVITVEPAATPAPSEASEAEASEAEASEAEDTESVAGSSSGASGYADQEEVSTLKRKVEVLEEANKKLKAVETENAALKLKLAAISAGFK